VIKKNSPIKKKKNKAWETVIKVITENKTRKRQREKEKENLIRQCE